MRNLPPPGANADIRGTVWCPGVERRWQLQRAAQRALCDRVPRTNRHGEEVAGFKYRVAMCHRGTDGLPPSIKRNKGKNRARFTGLQTCGSVWHCPICSAKVSGERRAELMQAMDAWVKQGGTCRLATYTFSHSAAAYGRGDLEKAMADMATALSKFKGSREYRRILEAAGVRGTVRALEVTYSWLNGWHVHTHEIVFCAADRADALDDLRAAWCRVLLKRGMAGLLPGEVGAAKVRRLRSLLRRACTVQGGEKAADYVAKFGADESMAFELTNANTKIGRGMAADDHLSPWAMLARANADASARDLFREYAEVFHGRRQLFWSKGLREFFFGVVERSDADIAAAPDAECTEFVCDVSLSDWHIIIARDARLAILRMAATSGADGVRYLIDRLRCEAPTHSGHYTENTGALMLRRAA